MMFDNKLISLSKGIKTKEASGQFLLLFIKDR